MEPNQRPSLCPCAPEFGNAVLHGGAARDNDLLVPLNVNIF